jgi:hypothetical protein
MATMIDPLRRAARLAPEAVAVRCGDTELTPTRNAEAT